MAKHFNELTPAQAERLALLAEECGEVVQAVGKILRHGYDRHHPAGPRIGSSNRECLEREIADVYVAIRMMFNAGDVRRNAVATCEDIKTEKLDHYLHHQRAASSADPHRTEG